MAIMKHAKPSDAADGRRHMSRLANITIWLFGDRLTQEPA